MEKSLHGVNETNQAIIPLGNVEYVEKYDINRASLCLQNKAAATRTVDWPSAKNYRVTFFYKYQNRPVDMTVWTDNGSGVTLTQNGKTLLANGEPVFDLEHENTWYRISLHFDRSDNTFEVYTDWRLRFQAKTAPQTNTTMLGPIGTGIGKAYWDQIVIYVYRNL